MVTPRLLMNNQLNSSNPPIVIIMIQYPILSNPIPNPSLLNWQVLHH
jgi:hypothetical protein